MKSVLYLKTIEHPAHLAGEPGSSRELHDQDAYLLRSEGYVTIPSEPDEEQATDERRTDEGNVTADQ